MLFENTLNDSIGKPKEYWKVIKSLGLPKNHHFVRQFVVVNLYLFYGKTKRYFKVRICEHLGISHLTEKKVKIDNNKLTAIQEHLLCCNYCPSFADFPILTRESNDFKLKIMESLIIARDKPILNKKDSYLPLELF